ncbi:class I glutamine amidotransferase-like protein [Karstenula rhodostoma CBS 690.94]|uniref:Class I glutamine amidotransferase-like protein n=1 Tax=Karstenula rhodostoma CBS 690.94 TaxID=1392251 RepID=A0A9P4P9D2_9PLEO|nr:class I glutamine amidotransferase-like protein [Karstenula rhodostoma CBS 690.94]
MPTPTHIAILLFPGFQLLDITGPLDTLNTLSRTTPLRLTILATTLDPVSTALPPSTPTPSPSFAQSILPTHTLATAPPDIDVLLIPGGLGTRAPETISPLLPFIEALYPTLSYLLTVCTGSAILAQTPLLDGRRATSNKKAFNWVKARNSRARWVAKARWVVDGNVWTSSGVAAGMDMVFAWVESVWGREVADELADGNEYERNRDSTADRFSGRWGAED